MITSVTLRFRLYQVLDAATYAGVLTLLVFAGSYAVSLVFGSGWLAVEFLMFLAGWVLFAYGTLMLRPTPPWNDQGRSSMLPWDGGRDIAEENDDRTETTFQRAVGTLPPLRWLDLPVDHRLSTGTKVFLSSIFVLVASFLIERFLVV
ncbi:DUF7555 family protein [Haladaptatus sp.]|uniref:DUF7555 family protein n=1 Tax=Haladaptatus sp. TaxID=1973141 RepID=UPI003C62733B